MKKRLFPFVLVFALIVSLAGCGQSKAGSSAASSAEPASAAESETPAAEAQPAAEPTPEMQPEETPEADAASDFEPDVLPYVEEAVHFTGWTGFPPFFNNFVTDVGEDFQALRVASERTGIYIDWTTVSADAEAEAFMLMVAGGTYPDLMANVARLYTGGEDKAINEEIIIDLTDIIAENAPNVQALLDSDEDLKKSVVTGDGHIASFFSCYYEAGSFPNAGGMGIRQDWLDKLDLEVPQTYDELHEVLTAFKSEYGATMFISQSGSDGHQSLCAGYGVTNGDLFVVDGVVKSPYLEDGYLEYLTMLNTWYSEGLFDPDFIAYGEDDFFNTHIEDATSGDNGVYYIDTDLIKNIPDACDDPDCNVVAMQNVTKTPGETLHLGQQENRLLNKHWAISTACKDPATLAKYANYFFTEDGIMLTNYGVEGETYVVNDAGEYDYTDLILENPDLPVTFALHFYTDTQCIPYMNIYGRDNFTLTDRQIAAQQVWQSDDIDFAWNMPNYVALTADESSRYATIQSDLDTLVDENVVKFIIGDRSLDEYPDFVSELKQMGIDEAIEIYQGAYDRVA